ncbi:MAG: Rho termination factor N-terminal domain-containing protein [Aeromicrobium sp.]
MSDKNGRHGLVGTLTTGMRDIPRNASWLVGKAISPGGGPDGEGNGSAGSGGIRDGLRSAKASVQDALPGQDSVEARLSRARHAAERAQAAERDALEAAQRASELAKAADETARAEKAHLQEVKTQQRDEVQGRVAEARRKADEEVARVDQDARDRAEGVLAKERAASEERADEARAAAERAQREAEEAFRDATAQLADARARADEAATAANEAAEQARAQAEQIAASAQRDAASAQAAVSRVEEVRTTTARTAAHMASSKSAAKAPGQLKDLTKAELLDLAAAEGISGRTSMSKQELTTAINRAGTKLRKASS